MLNRNSHPNDTSGDLEKEVINRFRIVAIFVPQECRVFREPWEFSTIVCLDFEACPDLIDSTKKQAPELLIAAQSLGLANSVIFRIGHKIIGWNGVMNSF